MKLAKNFRVDPGSCGVGLFIGCFLVSLTYVTLQKSDMLSFPMLASQMSPSTDTASTNSSAKNFSSSQQLDIKDGEGISLPCDPKSGKCEVDDGSKAINYVPTALERMQIPVTSDSKKPDVEAKMRPMCDLSNYRCDICDLQGDIRIIGKGLSSVILVTPSSQAGRNESWQVKPYARKWDPTAMLNVREVNVRSLNDYVSAPQCTVGHTAPAIVFSMAGYLGNYFHDFTDVLVPLFQTARQFDGEVQFVITNLKLWWIGKYMPYFKKLSRYEIIDYDNDARVHCFKHVIVGLRSDKDLTIDPSKSPTGSTMVDFMKFMRSTYSLDRDYALRISEQVGKKKPRLLILSRGRTRKFMNVNKIAGLAKKVGFEVVVSEASFDVANFAHIVNSCDVMMGVHGAGLTNFVFLPTNAVLIQVVPFGKLDWIASNYFGNPSKEMKLKYLEYTISEEESSLTELYPRDDPVFKDPKSVHKLGWFKMGEIYLDKQNVRLDLRRFKPVLLKALKHLK